MENSELTEKELNTLRKIVVITRSIVNNYYNLIKLENDGNKDTSEYSDIVSELAINFEMEDELYSKFTDLKTISDLLYYVNGNEEVEFENFIFSIMGVEPDRLIKERIAYKLKYMLDILEMDEDKTEEFEDLSDEDIKRAQNLEKEILIKNQIQLAIEYDYVNTMLHLLEEYINNPFFKSVKYELIEYKYLLIYITSDLEKELVKRNYVISDELNFAHNFVSNIFGFSKEYIRDQEDDYSIDLLEEGRELLLSLLDSKIEVIIDIQDSDYLIDAAIFSTIIRTSLIFSSKGTVINFIDAFKEDVQRIESKNETVVPIIEDIIAKYETDREIPNILTLKREK